MKKHPEMPQKIQGLHILAPGDHGFQTPSGKFELDSNTIRELSCDHLDPLPTYVSCALLKQNNCAHTEHQ